MRSPWPVSHREDVAVATPAAFAVVVHPDSATVEGGVADANFELFSKTRTSWIVPLERSAMIEGLWLWQLSFQIKLAPSYLVRLGLRNNFCAFARASWPGRRPARVSSSLRCAVMVLDFFVGVGGCAVLMCAGKEAGAACAFCAIVD